MSDICSIDLEVSGIQIKTICLEDNTKPISSIVINEPTQVINGGGAEEKYLLPLGVLFCPSNEVTVNLI